MKLSEIEIGATYTQKGTAGYVVRRVFEADENVVRFVQFTSGQWQCELSMDTERFLKTQKPIDSPLDNRRLLALKKQRDDMVEVERLRKAVREPYIDKGASFMKYEAARDAAFKGVL